MEPVNHAYFARYAYEADDLSEEQLGRTYLAERRWLPTRLACVPPKAHLFRRGPLAIVAFRGTFLNDLEDFADNLALYSGAEATRMRFRTAVAFVRRLLRDPTIARLELVGHSLGGSVALHVLQALEGQRRNSLVRAYAYNPYASSAMRELDAYAAAADAGRPRWIDRVPDYSKAALFLVHEDIINQTAFAMTTPALKTAIHVLDPLQAHRLTNWLDSPP